MKIAFISTRGIPNNYGGFEQFAEYISVGLAARGHEVVVYSPHFHPYKKDTYKGVRIKHIYSPETWMGSSVGSFFYDFASLKDALKKRAFRYHLRSRLYKYCTCLYLVQCEEDQISHIYD